MFNYDYIVENLCENRDRPMLNCDGKCYLAKKLVEESKENSENPFKSELTKFELPIINWVAEQNMLLTYFDFLIIDHQWYSRFTSSLFATDILHPPQAT